MAFRQMKMIVDAINDQVETLASVQESDIPEDGDEAARLITDMANARGKMN